MKRSAGILFPVFSLPSKYGIGGFSKEAYDFVRELQLAGQSFWQILPLGPVCIEGSGSPYQSVSAFAGNPFFISLDRLIDDGLLTEAECEAADTEDGRPDRIDYEALFRSRPAVLHLAFERFDAQERPDDYRDFLEENRWWLDNYCLYCVIRDSQDGAEWSRWPEELRRRDPQALSAFTEEHQEEIRFYAFEQYEFDRQWQELKVYANSCGIQIIGDIPIYVSMDSADAWSEPELFQFDEDGRPKAVSGCPPDAFSETGQLWGNPLYDWDYHKKTGYRWWISRMKRMNTLYDVVRIDHFRGFNDYWSIPYGDKTAENGHWEKGPGLDLFRTLDRALGKQQYIAEDLGLLTDDVRKMVKESGYPGMKVLEFAFDSGSDNLYLPHHYDHNCVVYTGTHDNDTLAGWLKNAGRKIRHNLKAYTGHPVRKNTDVIRLAMASTADVCIIPMQDWLGLGSEARINTPNTVNQNWRWRMLPEQFDDPLADEIREMTELYSRLER